MLPYRGFVVWDAGIFIIIGAFLFFMMLGWPGDPDNCVTNNVCYCEAFDPAKVMAGAPGVRQAVNTWFNLYAIATSFIVALFVYLDRVDGKTWNVIRSNSLIPDAYIFAVLFLGLGSMWFHASLTNGVSWLDGLSMYLYAAFLVFYTIRRIWHSDLFFWIAYPATVIGFTILGALWTSEYASLILIVTLVAAYLTFEIIAGLKQGKMLIGTTRARVLWILGVSSMGLATLFWALSQTGRTLCDPDSFFQPHGILWHPLAGVMAVLLYFYWREEKPV
jgi:hypothetical protein